MKHILSIAIIIIAISSLALGQTAGKEGNLHSKTAQEIRQIDNERIQAMLRGDTATLNRILSDDLTYTHSSGRTETKQQFIDGIKSGARKYEMLETDEVQVRVYGEGAVVTGRAKVKVNSGGQANNFQIRFTSVYINQQGRWQFAAWQSTRIPQQ